MPLVGASYQTNRPSDSVSASQSSAPLKRAWLGQTAAPATGRPWASTTRPSIGRRRVSRTTCAGVSGLTTISRSAVASPGAMTVMTGVARSGSRQRPDWNWPFLSVVSRRNILSHCGIVTTTVAPETGRPNGLKTVPETERPVFMTCSTENVRALSAVVSSSVRM